MSVRRILNVVGLLQIFTGLSMIVAGGVSLFYMDGDSFGIFLAAVLTSVFGFLTFNLTKFKGDLSSREGFAIVTFAWTGAALFGSLPYIFTGTHYIFHGGTQLTTSSPAHTSGSLFDFP